MSVLIEPTAYGDLRIVAALPAPQRPLRGHVRRHPPSKVVVVLAVVFTDISRAPTSATSFRTDGWIYSTLVPMKKNFGFLLSKILSWRRKFQEASHLIPKMERRSSEVFVACLTSRLLRA